MGYELKLYVMMPYVDQPKYNPEDKMSVPRGQLLAMVDLCKPGYDSHIMKLDEEEPKLPKLALWTLNPDDQESFVEACREMSEKLKRENADPPTGYSWDSLEKAINMCEDGIVTKDRYDRLFRVHPIDDVIQALEKDQAEDPFRRFMWALSLMKAIKESFKDSIHKDHPVVLFYGY